MSEYDQTSNPDQQPMQPPPTYSVPPEQPYTQPPPPAGQYKSRSHGIGSVRKEKWPAAVLAFMLGWLGIHKFYLGYKTEGLTMLLISLIGGLCFGLGYAVIAIISIIEAVKYVTLTEEDFEATYVRGYKGWF
ncbi:MAG: NINE protein [Coriobacteriales bacterium]|nr:NINE protein [Coriobacteriales bacterium]